MKCGFFMPHDRWARIYAEGAAAKDYKREQEAVRLFLEAFHEGSETLLRREEVEVLLEAGPWTYAEETWPPKLPQFWGVLQVRLEEACEAGETLLRGRGLSG